MSWFPSCACFGKLNNELKTNGENIYYTASRNGSLRVRRDENAPNEVESSTIQRKKVWIFRLKPKKKKKLQAPLAVPESARAYSPQEEIPNINDINPTYESVDTINTRVPPPRNNSRYDYPSFNRNQRGNDDVLYASASQTYSLGSEDPYSSIVSDVDGVRQNKDDNSVGYARVSDDHLRQGTSRTTMGRSGESLYSKINKNNQNRNRMATSSSMTYQPSTSTSNGVSNTFKRVPSEPSKPVPEAPFKRISKEPELEPYKAVPVEAFEPTYQTNESGSGSITSSSSRNPSYKYLTVRETLGVIRERIRQREEGNDPNILPPTREHYYSTINNDYETVRDVQRPLVIDVTENIQRPRPPTSPVPNHVPTMVRSLSSDFFAQEIPIHLTHSQTTPCRPIIISLVSRRCGGSVPDITPKPHKSRIPIPVQKPKKKPQKCNKKQVPPTHPIFLPTGKDYVSMIDFGEGKGWPFSKS